ncbi:TraX family protein [Companilactobacillus huachuanensis]|uniref:TraX family protein n=1 Tax=Companilactobacillus huachuanensis TaxID=2559914 RepID=A0ABW1RPT5_9LACO|nr:TraX family protein [Companilactobacillus huachuanensis]
MQQFTPDNSSKAMNRETFKIILMGLMVLDHITFFISPYLADFFHIITRVVAVGFAYLVVEGMFYTHSRRNYVGRLIGWGIFMALGNYLMNLFVLRKQYLMSITGDNIFLTLAIGALVIWLWDNRQEDGKKRRNLRILSIIVLILGCLPIFEGSFVILPFMLITQLTYKNVKKRDLWYIFLAILMAVVELPTVFQSSDLSPLMIFDGIAMNASNIFFILIIPILHFYNGRIGKYGAQLKYLFYIFYPLHLWLIHLIANFQ